MNRVRSLLATLTARRLLLALAALLVCAQFMTAGHAHDAGHAHGQSHAHYCELCVAQDRMGPAPSPVVVVAATTPLQLCAQRDLPLPLAASIPAAYSARAPPALVPA
ncbi:MAG: hypothetical protein KA224_07610 [Steroidobacteraceae bacterium]|nr:hypothetical protein [Steroidobacteraceae bacterium]